MRKRFFLNCLLMLTLVLVMSTSAFAISESDVESAVSASGKEAVSGNVLVWFLCAIAFLKVSQKIDSFLSSLGLNVGHTGGSMLSEAMIAMRAINTATSAIGSALGSRSRHGSAPASGKPGGGSAAAAGFFSGGLVGMASRKIASDAVRTATTEKNIVQPQQAEATVSRTHASKEQLSQILKYIDENALPYLIIGNGSNLLVKDGGIRGIVIEFGDNFNNFEIDGNIIKAQAGALLAVLGKAALREELTGFECISGIPGSLGGGLAMNAGAYGGEIKSVVKSVRVMNPKGEIFEFSNEEMKFEYRRSILTNSDYIVLSAVLELQKGNYDEIKAFMADLTNRRTTKQPLNLPSAGSTFKRPEGYFAGKLIDDCGLRGLTLRGAQVSEKHCGFVVNIGDATAKDILDLMYIVKSTVLNKFGVTLEEEVKILGED